MYLSPPPGARWYLIPLPWAHAPRLIIYRRSAALLLAMRWTYLIVIPREQSESRDPFDSAFGLAQDKPAGIQQTNAQPMDPSTRSRRSLGRDDRAGGPVSPAVGMTGRGDPSRPHSG